jgi:hypothetical protein
MPQKPQKDCHLEALEEKSAGLTERLITKKRRPRAIPSPREGAGWGFYKRCQMINIKKTRHPELVSAPHRTSIKLCHKNHKKIVMLSEVEAQPL